MNLDETLERYNKLPVIVNGKEVERSPMTKEEMKEYQIKFGKMFYKSMKESLAPELKKYENLKIVRQK